MEISERLNKKLVEAYNEEIDSKKLYKKIIKEKGEEDVQGNWHQFLYSTALYRYYLHSDINNLVNGTLPMNMPKGLNYGQFKKELGVYKLFVHQNNVLEDDTYYDFIYRGISYEKNNTGFTNDKGWMHVNRNLLDKLGKEDEPLDYKIYVPVANKDLERFALMLILKSMNNDVDYDFKYNSINLGTRSDSLVIYATKNNISKYIEMIDKIIQENPDIQINREMINPFGLPINDSYSVAQYLDKKDNSYSGMMCDTIIAIKSKSNNEEEFINNVKNLLELAYTTFETALENDGVLTNANKVIDAKPSTYNTKQEDKKTRHLV